MKKLLQVFINVCTFGIPLLIRALYDHKQNGFASKVNDVTVVKVIIEPSSGSPTVVELSWGSLTIPVHVDYVEKGTTAVVEQKGVTHDE